MPFRLYDYLCENGRNDFKAWAQGLQKAHLAKLNVRLDMLSEHGEALFPDILTGTSVPGIFKLRVKSNVQLRPMLCRGPVDIHAEYTLLAGAIEVGGKLKPVKADEEAGRRKSAVQAAPKQRRKDHERIA